MRFRNKLIITLVIFAVLVGAASYFLIKPLIGQINKLDQDITASREELAVLTTEQVDLQEVQQNREDVLSKKNEIVPLITTRENIRGFVESLELIAQETNLEQKIGLPDLQDTDELTNVPLGLTINGSYQDLLNYLLKLELLDQHININAIDLQSTGKTINESGEQEIKAVISATIMWKGL